MLLLAFAFIGPRCSPSQERPPGTNRLYHETSPYLQLHARNPVDWYPWGEEAIELARSLDKPIFLSVGYSTCYWCHRMEEDVFDVPEIAAIMNAGFINIKVDREERPDLDEIYMTATQLITRRGGWPNSVFLTPDLEPFFAGTYFPPEDRGNMVGFPTILDRIRELWTTDRARIEESAARIKTAMEDMIASRSRPGFRCTRRRRRRSCRRFPPAELRRRVGWIRARAQVPVTGQPLSSPCARRRR